MNPILKYIKDILRKKRVVGNDQQLTGLVKADMLLQELVDMKKVPGISVTVMRNGEKLLQKGYGYANIENGIPMDPGETICRIASISKNIAAIALAHMVKDGMISLDASFYKYVPYFPKKQWDFTIRQLASHTAGIRGYRGLEYGLNKPYSIQESIAIFKDDDLLFEPGTDYLYTSFDWVLISLAMQEASGIPFEEYTREKVLRPLDMTKTLAPSRKREGEEETLHLEDRNPGTSRSNTVFQTRATYYTKNRFGFRKAIPVNNHYKLAGGGFLSTSGDIAKFGQAVLDEKALDKEHLDEFLTSETVKQNKTYYGLGWQVSEDKHGRPYYGHVGNGVGGYSNLFVYPREQMVFAALINCTNPGIQDELNMVQDRLLKIEG
ncbi:serine hydrolase domain-containing protein [Maribacter sp. 2307UL18-2]|uniref:serine hydrolase domain-containing protein n=1 Tax=Maribacter sp. 2307UL18-2 TaxID=3386274 RepID=UPI0039BC5F7A